MVNRSAIAGVASVMMLIAAGTNPAAAQGACPAGCDGATNWTGFWLGAGLGVNADMIGHDFRETNDLGVEQNNGSDDSRGGDGIFGSIGLGYDWHVRDRFVIGAFTDFDFGNSEHSETDFSGDAGPFGWDIERNTTWNIGARFGILTSNTAMFYGVVGYSRTDLDIEVIQVNGANESRVSRNIDFSGYFVGAGLEQDLGNGFSLKGEYRYTDYNDESFGSAVANLTGDRFETDNFDLDSHSFRLTLAYKFHRGGAPVQEVSYKDIPPAPSYSAPYK